MGLDVYLTYYPEGVKESIAKEEEYNKQVEELYKKYPEDDQRELRNEMKKKIAEELGLHENGDAKGSKSVEQLSALYPDHYFKVGYFRSSYNQGGTNAVLRQILGKDLYDIFKPDGNDDYMVVPDWKKALKTTNDMISDFKKAMDEEMFKAETVTNMGLTQIVSPEQALGVFKLEREQFQARQTEGGYDFGDYSNRNGHFYFKNPFTVIAVIPGIRFGSPCSYVIYKADKEDLLWYLQALEITRETIEYVLGQWDIENYCLRWSS